VTTIAMGESFHDGNQISLFIGISTENNFIFILVTASKLSEYVQELPRPVMQSNSSYVTCY
jgi:hypothetical protein